MTQTIVSSRPHRATSPAVGPIRLHLCCRPQAISCHLAATRMRFSCKALCWHPATGACNRTGCCAMRDLCSLGRLLLLVSALAAPSVLAPQRQLRTLPRIRFRIFKLINHHWHGHFAGHLFCSPGMGTQRSSVGTGDASRDPLKTLL